MAINKGIFGDETNLKERLITDQKQLGKLVKHWKGTGLTIVLTSGTWDLFHVGHAQYLEKAKNLGDILIVGVDSDEKVKKRKGPHRPIVPEDERVKILSHIRHVDVISLKHSTDPKDNLIKKVKPDILVVSETTKHARKEVQEKKRHCGRVIVFPSQSKTSTTAKIRLMHVKSSKKK